MSKDLFDPKNEAKSNFISWGKPGDWIKGSLVSVREVVNQLKGDGSKQKLYELKAESGEFHDILEDKTPANESTKVSEGEFWIVGGKAGIDAQFRNVKIGQIVGLKFVETVPAKQKGYSPTKIVKLYTAGEMDPTVMEGVGPAADDGFGGM